MAEHDRIHQEIRGVPGLSVPKVEIQTIESQSCLFHPQAMDPDRQKRREEIQKAMSFIQ